VVLKVYIGPQEVSGLMWAYRCALRSVGVDASLEITRVHKYNYPYDRLYGIYYGKNYLQQLRSLFELVRDFRQYDVFHFFSGLSLFPRNKDIPILKHANKTIATTFIGTDARCDPLVLNGEIDKEDCRFRPWCRPDCPMEAKKKMIQFWGKTADVVFAFVDNHQIFDFYSIPCEILPLPCDTTYWSTFDSTYTKDPEETLILHAPSSRHRKGTDEIIQTVAKLCDEGYNINLKLLEDVPNSVIREWTNIADITIDRTRGFGWYGMFATQSMSMGKPVVGYITDIYKKTFGYGSKFPIISLEHQSLYDTLIPLLDNPTLCERIGHKGRSYVLSEHDEKIVGAEMLRLYMRDR